MTIPAGWLQGGMYPNIENIVNVKAFGAKGDGVSDDRPAIQAALDWVRTVGGGTVFIPASVTPYVVSAVDHPIGGSSYPTALVIGANTRITGAGRGASVVKLIGGQPDQTHMTLNYNIVSGGDENMSVGDIDFDGNAANQSPTNRHYGVVWFRSRRTSCERVKVLNIYGTNSGSGEGFFYASANATDSYYTDCQAIATTSNTATGFSCDSSSNVVWSGCIAYGMGQGNGFTHNTCENLRYESCHSYLNAGHGFNSEVSEDVQYSNCIAGGQSTAASTYPYNSNTTLGNVGHGYLVNNATNNRYVNCVAAFNADGWHCANATNTGALTGCSSHNNLQVGFNVSFGPAMTLVNCDGGSNGTADVQCSNAFVNTVDHGIMPSPTVPLTTVAQTNIFNRAATVFINANGATITSIKIESTVLGVIAGAVRVPANQTITLTYTVATPTWIWIVD